MLQSFRPLPQAHRLWIKVCANTSLQDALHAAEAGADAVGFIFAPSPRQVTPAQAATMAARLPPAVERVGVFVARSLEDVPVIAQAALQANLTAIQLHNAYYAGVVGALRQLVSPSMGIILTAHWRIADTLAAAGQVRAELARIAADCASIRPPEQTATQRVLIDSKVGHASGGLGIEFDWQAAQPVLMAEPDLRIIVAGGLTPDNVVQAVEVLAPYGVDVASGVERAPGRKDPAKVEAFIQKARAATRG